MNIAVCDDQQAFIDQLISHCEIVLEKKEVECHIFPFLSGPDLLASDCSQYDLVILDMSMPDMLGIEVAQKLRARNPTVEIIFITSYVEYALDGYKVQAFNYLLKEDLAMTFETCMNDVIKKIAAKNRSHYFKFVEGHISIALDELVYVESQATKLIFHYRLAGKNGEMVAYHLYGKLDDIQGILSNSEFIRTNQSYLINAKFISVIRCYYTELTTGEILSIPKARYSSVKTQYALYKGGL